MVPAVSLRPAFQIRHRSRWIWHQVGRRPADDVEGVGGCDAFVLQHLTLLVKRFAARVLYVGTLV